MSRAQLLFRRLASLSSANSALSTSNRIPAPPLRSSTCLPHSLSSSSFSSHSHSLPPPTDKTPPPPSADELPADVTTLELKKRIDRYQSGDAEALPFIFEAILARKLSGKHEDTDDELMDEFRSKISHDIEDAVSESDDSDSDSESSYDDSEFESDDDSFRV